MIRALIIDDDPRLGEMLTEYLSTRGVRASHALDGASGLAMLRQGSFDAIVLDVMLPDTDGFAICRQVRSDSDIPIIMLTARGDELDRIVGLELGADDYLPKPFNPRELLARLNAILRRSTSNRTDHRILRFARLEIDLSARVARLDGKPCGLTSHQFNLLTVLAQRAGRVQSREQLMEEVRGETLQAFDRSIDVHISRIRQVIEDDPASPRRILTVRGAGYVFATTQD